MKVFPLELALAGRYLVLRASQLEPAGIALVFTTRIWLQDAGPAYSNFGFYGKGGAEVNRGELCKALGLDPKKLTAPYQTHSTSIVDVHKSHVGRGGLDPNTRIPQTDGLCTDMTGVPLIVMTADCVPVVFFDVERGVVGAVHAGWKGILGGILENMGATLKDKYGCDPGAVEVVMGPCIGPDRYRVGDDLLSRLRKEDSDAVLKKNGNHFIDLRRWCELRLLSSGFSEGKISFADFCTAANRHLFYSYRADKAQRGSNAALIARRKIEKAS